MPAAPEFMDLTCPICGQVEQADGRGSVDITWMNGVLEMRLNYGATAVHICSGVTIPSGL